MSDQPQGAPSPTPAPVQSPAPQPLAKPIPTPLPPAKPPTVPPPPQPKPMIPPSSPPTVAPPTEQKPSGASLGSMPKPSFGVHGSNPQPVIRSKDSNARPGMMDDRKSNAWMAPDVMLLVAVLVGLLIGFGLVVWRMSDMTSQMALFGNRVSADYQMLTGKTEALIQADAKRDAAISTLNGDFTETANAMATKGEAIKTSAELQSQTLNALKAMEVVQKDEKVKQAVETLLGGAADIARDADALARAGKKLQETYTTPNAPSAQ